MNSFIVNRMQFIVTLIVFLLVANTSHSQALKDLTPQGKYVGTIANIDFFNDIGNAPNGSYQNVMVEQFSALVAENDHKLSFIMPNAPSNVYDINTYNINTNKLDRLIDFCNANAIKVKRGHTLMWHNQVGWLDSVAAGWSREEIYAFAANYITKVITYRAGEINEWDVFNEIISDGNDGFRTGTWYDNVVADGKTVQDFLDHCFITARNALTTAIGATEGNKVKLYYNDYSIEAYNANPNSKNGFMRQMVTGMINRGIPIDAIGLQGHFISPVDQAFTNAVSQTMDEIIGLGLICNITELDIRICNGGLDASIEELEAQKDSYQRIASMAISKTGSTGITLWGFTDASSWVPGSTNGACGEALIYDKNYDKKPSYFGLVCALQNASNVPQSPYLGSPVIIPGIVEFENYDFGGQGVSYNDTDISNNGVADYRGPCDAVDITLDATGTVIGWLAAGEWLEYTVNITQTGVYDFTFSTAANTDAGGTASVEIDGINVSGPIAFSSTGSWSTYLDTEVSSIQLSAGVQVLKFNIESGAFNIDNMTIVSSTLNTNTISFDKNLSIYPLPFNNFLNINYNGVEKIEHVNLLDINGQKVYSQKNNNSAVILKIKSNAISSGLYFLQLNFKNRFSKVIKVIKE